MISDLRHTQKETHTKRHTQRDTHKETHTKSVQTKRHTQNLSKTLNPKP